MKLTIEQLRERDKDIDQELRDIVRAFVATTGYDLMAISCAGRLYRGALRNLMDRETFITEPVYTRIVNALEYLASLEVRRC